MSEIAIRVEDLGKRYRIGGPKEAYGTLRDSLVSLAKVPLRAVQRGRANGHREFWALRDVSFEVKRGEVLGVIGRNGAGKSTLLKILSRITEPTTGYAEIRGRVGSLLEVGTGFHPELTGRENIYLNGAILGMKKAEIDRAFDEIVEFAEIEKFLDTPVKRYSSGMYMRLAFSIAAHLEPEILIVDEVLAVGDATFQKKCLGKMGDVAKQGRTVLFVSHNMAAVQRLCTKCMLLADGSVQVQGDVHHVVHDYVDGTRSTIRSSYQLIESSQLGGKAFLEHAAVVNSKGKVTDSVLFGEPFAVRMIWQNLCDIPGLSYAIRIFDMHDRLITAVNSIDTSLSIASRGKYVVECRVNHNMFPPGDYRISIGGYIRPHSSIHVVDNCIVLSISKMAYSKDYQYNISGDPAVAVLGHWSIHS